jgi:cystathionine beta-lyase/cystathionine gamma-synthase
MGGAIASTGEWVARLRQVRAITGGLLHPMAAYLLHRGLRTLPVRMRAQQASAHELACRIKDHSAVARVLYPGLPGQDPKGVLQRQMAGPGAIVSIDLSGGYDAAATFTSACRLATHAVSLGGVDTLVQHPASLTHRPVAPARRPAAGVVRLSIGLEDVDDIVADVKQALDVVASAAVLHSMAAADLAAAH